MEFMIRNVSIHLQRLVSSWQRCIADKPTHPSGHCCSGAVCHAHAAVALRNIFLFGPQLTKTIGRRWGDEKELRVPDAPPMAQHPPPTLLSSNERMSNCKVLTPPDRFQHLTPSSHPLSGCLNGCDIDPAEMSQAPRRIFDRKLHSARQRMCRRQAKIQLRFNIFLIFLGRSIIRSTY